LLRAGCFAFAAFAFLTLCCARIELATQCAGERCCFAWPGLVGGHLQHSVVFDATAKSYQPRLVNPAFGDIDPRSDDTSNGRITGHVAQRSRNQEWLVAKLERVADVGVERHQQRRINKRHRFVLQARKSIRRHTFNCAVERIARTNGTKLHETRAAAADSERH
jgi:hypothetical protein